MDTLSKQHATSADREIVTSRLVNAPRALVWKVFTDPNHLSHWWGPNGFWSSTREYDFRVGGMWLFTMHGPDGTDYPNKVVFDEIDEPNFVFYKHMGEDSMSHVYFEAIISFEEQGDKTNVTLRSIFPTAQERDFVIGKYGAVEGAAQTLARLDQFVQHQQKKDSHKLELSLPSDLEARFSRLFDAPREMVWKAWTDREHLPKWMTGPDGWTMEVLENDLRPGGNWKYVWRKADSSEMGMHGIHKEIIAPSKLVSTENWGGPYPQTVNHLVLTEENGKTRMTLTIIYPTKEARENALKTGMDDGMTVSFDRLDKVLVSLSMNDVEKYLAKLPDDQREALENLRALILSVAKGAEEKISYGMPTVVYKGNLVHYAAFKDHMSLFGATDFMTDELKKQLAGYKTSKGTIQFTVEKSLPVALVKKIVKARIAENEAKAQERIDKSERKTK